MSKLNSTVAWLALFFSLAGTGLAASRYLITSVRQIKPTVVSKLRGHEGPPGPRGATGPAGPAGPAGAASSGELAELRERLAAAELKLAHLCGALENFAYGPAIFDSNFAELARQAACSGTG